MDSGDSSSSDSYSVGNKWGSHDTVETSIGYFTLSEFGGGGTKTFLTTCTTQKFCKNWNILFPHKFHNHSMKFHNLITVNCLFFLQITIKYCPMYPTEYTVLSWTDPLFPLNTIKHVNVFLCYLNTVTKIHTQFPISQMIILGLN